MLVKPFSQLINPDTAFSMQNSQYMERLIMQKTVAAGQTDIGQVNVSNLGHFFCMFITGTFSTLHLAAGVIRDTGVNYLSGQLIDGAGQRKLFNDRIPFDLFLSPGRRKDGASTTVLADPAGNSLFYPIEFEYLFTANSMITMDVVNASDTPNSFEICFHGIRLISNMTHSARQSVPSIEQAPQRQRPGYRSQGNRGYRPQRRG